MGTLPELRNNNTSVTCQLHLSSAGNGSFTVRPQRAAVLVGTAVTLHTFSNRPLSVCEGQRLVLRYQNGIKSA